MINDDDIEGCLSELSDFLVSIQGGSRLGLRRLIKYEFFAVLSPSNHM